MPDGIKRFQRVVYLVKRYMYLTIAMVLSGLFIEMPDKTWEVVNWLHIMLGLHIVFMTMISVRAIIHEEREDD